MVNWVNNKCRIDNLVLELITNKIWVVKGRFEVLCFTHVYRESNLVIDQLSNEAFSLQVGNLIE
jgi:hypothetical protein